MTHIPRPPAQLSCRFLVYNRVMGKSLRRVLACVLMLAVPLQGFAAVAMLNCAPDHHNAAGPGSHAPHDHAAHAASPASQVAEAQHDHATHGHDGHERHAGHAGHAGLGGHADEATTMAGMNESAPDSIALQSLDAMAQLANTSCSACASCCSGAAIVSSMVIPAVFTAGSVPFCAATDSPVSFITDGPSRPPRPFLA